MSTYKINKINFPSVPTSIQTIGVEYKLVTDPESSYVLVSSGASINTNGTPVSNLIINPVTSGLTYNMRFWNLCTSPVEYWVETILMP